MHTTVINLYGGPGTGKSTLAAELYYKLKSSHVSCELVREYVKDWAWSDRSVNKFDQLYILGKQSSRESLLYNKVRYVITDSPILLGGFYGEHYTEGNRFVTTAAKAFLDLAAATDVNHIHFFLNRNKDYDNAGRYETEEQAKIIDVKMENFLKDNEINYFQTDCPDDDKASFILKKLYSL